MLPPPLQIIGGITFRYTAADVPITWSFDLLGHECANDREPAAQLLAVTAVSNLSVYVATTPTCNILLPVDEALWVTLLNSGPPPLALNVLRLCANLSAAGYPLNDLRSAITQLSMGLESKGGGRPSVGSLVSSNTAAKFYVTVCLVNWSWAGGAGSDWTLPQNLSIERLEVLCCAGRCIARCACAVHKVCTGIQCLLLWGLPPTWYTWAWWPRSCFPKSHAAAPSKPSKVVTEFSSSLDVCVLEQSTGKS